MRQGVFGSDRGAPSPGPSSEFEMKKVIVSVAVVSALVAASVTVLVMKATQSAPGRVAAIAPPVQARSRSPSANATPGAATRSPQVQDFTGAPSTNRGDDEAARMRTETAALARQFRAQPRDAAWASKTEQTLRDTMTSEVMLATEIVPLGLDYSCRTDLCLVKAEFARHGDAEDWGIMLVTAAGETFANARPMVIALPDGKAELQLFATRR